ncbi:MAG: transcription antitermination factor NusB [Microthrixaceae bacterium]
MTPTGPTTAARSPRRPRVERPLGGVGRREARERALLLVYEASQRGLDAEGIVADQAVGLDPYTDGLIRGVERHGEAINAVIGRLSREWPLERMPAIDRAILRIGVYELGHEPEVPTAVVLNEAVELANSYSTDDSGRFVNGVLAAAAAELRPPAA